MWQKFFRVNIDDMQLNKFTKQIYVGLHFKSAARQHSLYSDMLQTGRPGVKSQGWWDFLCHPDQSQGPLLLYNRMKHGA